MWNGFEYGTHRLRIYHELGNNETLPINYPQYPHNIFVFLWCGIAMCIIIVKPLKHMGGGSCIVCCREADPILEAD